MKYRKNVYDSLILITQFSINMLVPIGLCSLLGWYMDQKFGTVFLFIVFFFLGAIAGFRNVYRMAKKIFSEKSEKDTGGKKK